MIHSCEIGLASFVRPAYFLASKHNNERVTDDPHTGRPPRSMSYVASSSRVLEFALTCDPFVRDRTSELVGDAVSHSSARYCVVGGDVCPMARGFAYGSLAGLMHRVEGKRRGEDTHGRTAQPSGACSRPR